jgi:hypothetical protein
MQRGPSPIRFTIVEPWALRSVFTRRNGQTMMSDQTPYLRMARCLILVARRQSVDTDAASYNRFVMRNAAAEESRDGGH